MFVFWDGSSAERDFFGKEIIILSPSLKNLIKDFYRFLLLWLLFFAVAPPLCRAVEKDDAQATSSIAKAQQEQASQWCGVDKWLP